MGSEQGTKVFAHGQAARPLNVIVVGAGMAGLTVGLGLQLTGHHVTIMERASSWQEAGAGIQIAANAVRILSRFGVLAQVMKHADVLERISQRRYADDQELGSAPVMPDAQRRYGAPVLVMHRGDLQRVLVAAAEQAGCRIETGQAVVRVDSRSTPCMARVQTANNRWHQADLVLGADGLRSAVRAHVAAAQGHGGQLSPTGDAAYRILIPRARLAEHPELVELAGRTEAVRWIGPRGHIVGYPIRHRTAYNLVVVHPAAAAAAAAGRKKADVADFCRGWSPLVQLLLSCVPDGAVAESALLTQDPLEQWADGRVALLGDACHPMLPYTAQGAANAIEDAGALVTALTRTGNVHLALAAYQELRQPRTRQMQAAIAATAAALHLPDGGAQRCREEAIRCATAGFQRGFVRNPDLWADRLCQDFMWGVDIVRDMEDGWDQLLARVRARHVLGPGSCCCCGGGGVNDQRGEESVRQFCASPNNVLRQASAASVPHS